MDEKLIFILASMSPRRRELISYLKIPFDKFSPDIDEASLINDPQKMVRDLSKRKALFSQSFLGKKGRVYLSADTTVSINSQILNKPIDVDDARSMLLKLSGKTHDVFTGVTLLFENQSYTFDVKTEVSFLDIPKWKLDLYLESGEPLDKAGSYGIQGEALSFIDKINGSYSNVVGLPIAEVSLALEKFIGPNWRKHFV